MPETDCIFSGRKRRQSDHQGSSCLVEITSSKLKALSFGAGKLSNARINRVVELVHEDSRKCYSIEFEKSGKPGLIKTGWSRCVSGEGFVVGDIVLFQVQTRKKISFSVIARRLSGSELENICKGPDLVGFQIVKEFMGQLYVGTVKSWDEQTDWYKICYEDGDQEELAFFELEKFLVTNQSKTGTEFQANPKKLCILDDGGGAQGKSGKGGNRRALPPNHCVRRAAAPDPAESGGSPSLKGKAFGGAGLLRDAQAFYAVSEGSRRQLVQLPVGPWIREHTRSVHRYGGDKRYMDDREPLPDDPNKPASAVPGWLGVFTADGQAFLPGELAGRKFQACLYDTDYAVKVPVPRTGTVEEAARDYDAVALAYYGPSAADTNFAVDSAALERALLPPGAAGAPRGVVTAALRILDLGVKAAGCGLIQPGDGEGFEAWRQRLWEEHVTRAPRKDMIGALAKELGWLLSKVAPEAVAPEWRGAALERLIRECAACSLLGRRQHHYAAAADACNTCFAQGKQAGGRNTAHGMRTLCAIVRCAQDDVFAPLDALCSDAGENPAGSCDGSRRRRRPRKRIHSVRQAPPLEQRFEGKLPAGLRVIVVGAGVAGLKAAVELQRAGAEVVVLEGSERLGGRICTQVIGPKGRERPVDLGATFVCGTSRVPPVNPIFRFAVDELGLSLAPKRREGPRANTFYDRSLRPIPQAEVDEAEEMYAEILDAIMEEGERASADEPMASAVARLISERKLSPVQGDIVNSYMSDLYATTMDKISLKGAIAYGYDGLHELVRGGYQQVVDALVQGVTSKAEPRFPVTDIRFKHYVKIVRLTDTGVDCVTDVDGDQRTLNADCAVLTFPLGVLKSGDVEFSPELPRFKREAIEALDMGTENRVAMLFEKVFWPEDVHFLRPVLGRYTFANLHALGVDRVLCAWIRPEAVPQLETWSKEEIMADVERLLKCMFNEAYEAPLAYEVTYWLSNKFSYGSYSFVPVGATQEDFDRLAWPVCGVPDLDEQQAVCKGQLLNAKTRLFFAGEATHKEDAYTVHGAYESGSREANRICHWWSKNHQQLRQGLGDKV